MSDAIIDRLLLFVPVALILVLYLLLRKTINLFFIRLYHGPYSLEFVNAHRRYFYKNHLPQCIKDDFINHIVDFFNRPKKIKEYNTSEKIGFLDIPYGATLKEVLKKKKKPQYLNVVKSGNHVIKILGYTEDIFNIETRSYFYFINEAFFMGEYYFPEILKNQPAAICKALADKYKLSEVIDRSDYFIQDEYGTVLHYKNTGFSIMIRYFNNSNPHVADDLKDCVKQLTEVSMRLKDSETLNNWKTYL